MVVNPTGERRMIEIRGYFGGGGTIMPSWCNAAGVITVPIILKA